MSRQLLIDATHPEEARAAVVESGRVREFDYESKNKIRITGNIYLAKVVRAEPSLQAVFVEYGGNRHGFLAFSEIHPHYYKIPVADRQSDDAEASTEDESPKSDDPNEPVATEDAPETQSASAAETEHKEIAGFAVIDDGEPNATSEPLQILDTFGQEGGPSGTRPEDDPVRNGTDIEGAAEGTDEQGDTNGSTEVSEEVRQHRVLQRKYKVQEVIRQKQLLLVQVIKDERGTKGAALTTYISLAGRYCVLMPNTNRGGGISRKITNTVDRRKLKKIASEIEVPEGVGLIIRTAGANRTKQEIKRDYEYLIRQWDQIRRLTFNSIAPAKIFEDGGLIRRAIRDDYTKGIDEVVVDGEEGYKTAKSFMKMIMPSHAKKVKKHTGNIPLFAEHGIEQFLSQLFDPVVQLPSGGYIVIGFTEALIAIDVNSGKATRNDSLEQTALQTNLEAAEAIADQLRLRDLAGLIVIDFIDMEEGKHNAAVEKLFRERLKTDRSKIQVDRITNFGLLEMSRQRLKPGLLELSSQPCPSCRGTGMVRAEDSVALEILRRIEMKAANSKANRILATVPIAIANVILNAKRGTLAHIEKTHSIGVFVEGHPGFTGNKLEIRQVVTQTTESGDSQDKVIGVESSFFDDEMGDDGGRQSNETPKGRRRRSSRGQARRAARPPRSSGEGQEEHDSSAQGVQQESHSAEQPDGSGGPEQTERRGRRSRRRHSSRGSRKKDATTEVQDSAADNKSQAQEAVGKKSGRADEGTDNQKPNRRRRRSSSRRNNEDARTADAPVQDRKPEREVSDQVPNPPGLTPSAAESKNGGSNTSDSSTKLSPESAGTADSASQTQTERRDGPPLERRVGWWSPEFQNRQNAD